MWGNWLDYSGNNTTQISLPSHRTHSGGKPHAVGDRGQRYEVSVYNSETKQRQVMGWSDVKEIAEAMCEGMKKHPSWEDPEIRDRQPG